MATEFSNGKQTVKLYRSVNRGKEMYQLAFYQAGRRQLAADLSSGNEAKLASAVGRMIDRGMIRETPPDAAVEKVAKEIVEGRATGKEVVAVSSVHRISEAPSAK